MRTFQLSHEQIALIQQALGIAEAQAIKLHTETVKDLYNVRNNTNKPLMADGGYPLFNLGSKFAELNIEIANGKFDI